MGRTPLVTPLRFRTPYATSCRQRYFQGALADAPLVILDCDGVIVDSERIAVRVDAQVLAALGWPLTEAEIVERFVGRSHEFMVGELEAHLGRELASDWEDEFQHLYRDAFATELRPVDGIADALDGISLPTCVASSGSHRKIEASLRIVGLYERFAGRISARATCRTASPRRTYSSMPRKQWGSSHARRS